MGQTDSKENSKLYTIPPESDSKKYSKMSEFGDCKLLRSKRQPDQKILLREINLTDENQFNKQHKKYESRSRLNHQNIINILNHFYILEQQLCGQFYKIFLAFEYFPDSLQNFIGQGLKEPELWQLLNGTIQGLAYLQQNNIHHDFIHDSQIFINTEEMIVKVADPTYFTQQNMFVSVLQDIHGSHNCYLSPTLVKAIAQNNWQPKHNSFKSDVFSLGMVLLHAASRVPCNDCYHYEQGIFRDDIMIAKLHQLQPHISEGFLQILRQMLTIPEDGRPDFLQLSQILRASANNSTIQNQSEQISFSHNQSILEPSYQSNQQQQSTQIAVSSQQTHYQPSMIQICSQQEYMAKPQSQVTYPLQNQTIAPDSRNILIQENTPINPQPMIALKTQPINYQSPQVTGYHLRPPFQAEPILHIDQSQLQVNSTKNSRQMAIGNPQQLNHFSGQLPVQTIQTVQLQGLPQNPLSRDQPDTISQTKLSDQISKVPVIDENADPLGQDEEMNQLRATRKYDEPLKMSKANEFQPLSDYTNLFQKHDISKSQIQSGFKCEEKQIDSYQNQKLHLNYTLQNVSQQEPTIRMNQANTYNFSNDNYQINDRFSLPFDLPNQQNGYMLNKPEFDGSYQKEDRTFTNIISEQKEQPWKISGITNFGVTPVNAKREESIQKASNPNNNQFAQATVNHFSQSTMSHFNQPPTQMNQQSFYGCLQDTQQTQLRTFHEQNYQTYGQPRASPQYVVEQYSNGSRYEGEKLDGMRHGKGKFFYQDGGLYDGGWKENKMHGRGILYYATGQPAYDGEWIEDKFQGFGTLYNETPMQLSREFDYRDFDNVEEFWLKYQGEFHDDNKEGQGTLFLSNGERFVGSFSKDYINGQGLFYCLNRRVIDGRWINNKLIE